mmetsp:Transcript_100554/g.260293  ORF Transcript_100554/g.260293 Transcript_100554/m.260293 type:complete len:415 (-) Transcript_100554:9-1253(-)
MSSRPPEKGSEENAPKAKEWPELVVSGCADQTISKIVKGTYRVSTMNHNKPVYKKYEKAKGLDVLVYFWDDRDGLELCGWWFGPAVGGDQVWAFHPSRTSITPPANEWNIPNDGPIDPIFTITPRAKGSGSDASAEKKSEDVGGDDDVRRQIENMKRERDEFAARMEEIQRRAEERRKREEELKRRMEGAEDPAKSAKRSRTDDRDGAMATARAEEERRRLEREAQQKKEKDRRQAEEEARQKRDEERRRIDEEAQRRREERLRKEEEDARRRAERRKAEEAEDRRRRELEHAKRKEEDERRRKEEAKRQEERQRRLNEEAKKRKEEIAILGMFDAMARLSAATPQDFDGLKVMLERALETLLPYTGKQKATLKTEADRVLKRTEAYVKIAEDQQRKWEEWCDLREQVPMLLRS